MISSPTTLGDWTDNYSRGDVTTLTDTNRMYITCVGATLAVARREDSAMRELAGGRISFREMLYPSPTTLGGLDR